MKTTPFESRPRNTRIPLLFTLGLCLLGYAPGAAAQVSDEVLAALQGRPVVLERSDGGRLVGQVLSVTPKAVVLELEDGRVASVPRETLSAVRVVRAQRSTHAGHEGQSAQGPGNSEPQRERNPRAYQRAGGEGGNAVVEGEEAKRRARMDAALRIRQKKALEGADLLFNAGMGTTIGGLGLIVLAGILHGVAANKTCWDSACTTKVFQMGQAALAFYIIGPITAAAGIPMWIVGGVKASNIKERMSPEDPHHRRFEGARLDQGLPPSHMVASWQLRF